MVRPQRLVAIPVDLALVFSAARGWHYEQAPPAWWLEEQEALTAADEFRLPVVVSVCFGCGRRVVFVDHSAIGCACGKAEPTRRTSCRPGSGPCRRRHEHTSRRRAG